MNTVTAVRSYVTRMIEEAGPGMKVLLMDKETTSVISVVFSQSEILQKDVYLFERIDAGSREVIKHLKCICFLRPTEDNISRLCQELTAPKYGSYYVYFSNVVSRTDLKRLAVADEQECVQEVQELFADFVACSPHLFSLAVPFVYATRTTWDTAALARCTSGLLGVVLALRKCPAIRFQANSELARQLANQLRVVMTRESALLKMGEQRPTAGGGEQPGAVLMIMERSEDSVTPLLNEWTYQAMVHELIGITHDRVDLSSVPGVSRELSQVVLSPLYDEFFAAQQYANFADASGSVKSLMEDFQSKQRVAARIESIADMKAFVNQYPQFKRTAGTVSKHVTILSELSRQVAQFALLECSECEQQLVCHADHSAALLKIRALLTSGRLRELDALRLVALYALKFERHSNSDLNGLLELLARSGVSERLRAAVRDVQRFGGVDRRSFDLFGTASNPLAITKRFFKGLKGVENIYTQHEPLLVSLLDQLAKGRLRESLYTSIPFPASQQSSSFANSSQGGPGGVAAAIPQDVIVFMIGGVTYEESVAVHQFNKLNAAQMRVVLGGSTIHNTATFLQEVARAMSGPSASGSSVSVKRDARDAV